VQWDCECDDAMACRRCGATLKLEKLNDTEEQVHGTATRGLSSCNRRCFPVLFLRLAPHNSALQMDVTTEDIMSDDHEVAPASCASLVIYLYPDHRPPQVWPFDHSRAGVLSGALLVTSRRTPNP
jgi:hypothetical protein